MSFGVEENPNEILKNRIKKEKPKGRKPRVFVVDDEEEILEMIKDILEDELDIRIETYTTPEDLLKNYHPNKYEAGIIDIRMEGTDGVQLYDKIKEQNTYMPLMFFTAHQGEDYTDQEIKEREPFAYLPKTPEGIEQLKAVTTSAIEYTHTVRRLNALLEEQRKTNYTLKKAVSNIIEELEQKKGCEHAIGIHEFNEKAPEKKGKELTEIINTEEMSDYKIFCTKGTEHKCPFLEKNATYTIGVGKETISAKACNLYTILQTLIKEN